MEALFSKQADCLRQLFEEELQTIYWAEKATTRLLGNLVKNTSSDELAECIVVHLEDTKEQIERLEQVFTLLNKKKQARICDTMEALIAEANDMLCNSFTGVVKDACIIAALQKIEHVEIATYTSLVSFATALNELAIADLLLDILDEEKRADAKLIELSEQIINLEFEHDDLI